MNEYLESIIRTAIAFLLLITVTIGIGKQLNSHNNHFNFALNITIGSLIANMGFAIRLKFLPMLACLATLILIYLVLSEISLKSRFMRKWISGEPTVIVEKGKILDRNMKKIKYTIDDLNQHLRELGIFDVQEVEYAYLEVSGKLSVLKKEAHKNIVKQDIKLDQKKESPLPVELIMDGKILHQSPLSKYNTSWVLKECQKRKLAVEEIQYFIIGSNGKFFIDLMNDRLPSSNE